MKKMLAAVFSMAFLTAAGCHAQVPSNPTVYLCPATTGTAYTPLNQSSAVTTMTYTDATPPAGQYCYVVQSVITATGQVSVPSNTAGPLDVPSGKSVLLTWTAPTSGPAPTGYVVSRAPAIASTLGAPSLVNPNLALGGRFLAPSGSSFTVLYGITPLSAPTGLTAQ